MNTNVSTEADTRSGSALTERERRRAESQSRGFGSVRFRPQWIALAYLFTLLLSPLPLQAEGLDGDWWRHLDERQQTLYAVGFIQGNYKAGSFFYGSVRDLHPTEASSASVSDVIHALFENEKLWGHVTAAQLREGLTAFYEDGRNRSIRAQDAVEVVVRQFSGLETSKLVERLRQG